MSKKQSGITALYERLSRDDEQLGDSSSIVNQKKMGMLTFDIIQMTGIAADPLTGPGGRK